LLFQEDFLKDLNGLSRKILTAYMGWSTEEILALVAGATKDFRDPSIHAYLPINVVYGRKPGGSQ